MTQLPDPGADPFRRRPAPADGHPFSAGDPSRHPHSGSERYVRFLDPHDRGSSPYSVEGYLHGIGTFASGAVRAHGWRRTTAKALVILLLLPIALTVLRWSWTLLSLLISF